MKNLKLFFVGIIVLSGFFYSCDDLTDIETEINELSTYSEKEGFDYEVKDGILEFKNSDAFFSLGEKLMNMTPDELNSWELENSFTSLHAVIEKAYEELDTCTNIIDYNKILASNNDVIVLNDNSVDPVIQLSIYQYVANRKGYFTVNGVLHKITQDGLYTNKEMNFSIIEQAIATKHYNSEAIFFAPVLNKKSILKSQTLVQDYHEKKTDWNNRRRCKSVIDLQLVIINDGYNVEQTNYLYCFTDAVGRNVFGKEKLYKSKHYCEDFTITIKALNEYREYGRYFHLEDETYSISYHSAGDYTRYFFVNKQVGNRISVPINTYNSASPAHPKITIIEGEFYTRGSAPLKNIFDYTN
ncbi:MAG: hypothetical protein JXR50_03835 [Prolixibacteraceae bacterium]|nr:hypothetical protein [Prolixibacteraceae bacterium]